MVVVASCYITGLDGTNYEILSERDVDGIDSTK